MSTARELTTTSYAILGLLAIKPWTTYELAQQMDRALGLFWPRTRSKLYEEPKKLVARGLARASSERTGKRPRTVYTITPKGRRALAAWVPAGTEAGPTLEFEQLVRLFFAEHATREDLLATFDGVYEWLEAQARLGIEITGEYLAGRGAFPERLPWLLLVGRFLDQFERAVEEWADWAVGVVEQWPDDLRSAPPEIDVLEEMAQNSEDRVDRAARRRRQLSGS
jgi:PadR family transcriptional regulator, regulatory protein AphA